MATLSSSWSVRHAAGEPFAVVRVSHLSGPVSAGQDAWGRPGKKQPVLVSAEVSFRHAFDTAAADDKLGIDTVHYGNLSKAILNSLDAYNPSVTVSASAAPRPSIKDATLRAVLEKIWSDLTGRRVDGSVSDDAHLRRPFLTLDRVRFLEVSVRLPKASLLGEAVSLTASSVFGEEDGGSPEKYGLKLALHNLRVPVLIGVNANERLSKQFVVTSATVDKFVAGADGGEVERRRKEMLDLYTGLEAHITKVCLHTP